MSGPNECGFILCTTEPTGTSHRQVRYWGGCLQLHRHQLRAQAGCWAWFLAQQQASACCLLAALLHLQSRDATAQRCLQCFPSSIPPVMQHQKGSREKDVCGCPLSSIRQWEGKGRKEGETLRPHAFLFLPAADGELPPAFPLEVYRKGELISFD